MMGKLFDCGLGGQELKKKLHCFWAFEPVSALFLMYLTFQLQDKGERVDLKSSQPIEG